jgi:hypothetical protein
VDDREGGRLDGAGGSKDAEVAQEHATNSAKLGIFFSPPKPVVADVRWSGQFTDKEEQIFRFNRETEHFFNAHVIQMMDYLRAVQLGIYVVAVVVSYHVDSSIFALNASTGGSKLFWSIALDILQFYPIIDMLMRLTFLYNPRRDFQYRLCNKIYQMRFAPNPAPFAPYEAHSHAVQHVLLANVFVTMTVIMRVYNYNSQTAGEAAVAKLTAPLMLIGNTLIHSAQFG